MKSPHFRREMIIAGILAGLAFAPIAVAAAKKPQYTVKEVMKEIHKGDDNIGKRAVKGEASKEDIAKMVHYYESLPLNDPPRGDKTSWLEKTSALFKASQQLQSGAPGAVDAYKAASNCKACHNLHKPENKDKK